MPLTIPRLASDWVRAGWPGSLFCFGVFRFSNNDFGYSAITQKHLPNFFKECIFYDDGLLCAKKNNNHSRIIDWVYQGK